MALLSQGADTVSLILRENNRFNDTLARLETAAPAGGARADPVHSRRAG